MADSGYTPTQDEIEDFCAQWGLIQSPHIPAERTREAVRRFVAVIREDQAKKDAVAARMRAQEFRNSVKAAWDNGEAMNLDVRLAAGFALDEFSLLLSAQSFTGMEKN